MTGISKAFRASSCEEHAKKEYERNKSTSWHFRGVQLSAMVNLNARDRAAAAHAAAARYGRVSPSPPPSRPSSRPSSRPVSASPKRPKRPASAPAGRRIPWVANVTVLRSFVEIAAAAAVDTVELQLGPKELKFQELFSPHVIST